MNSFLIALGVLKDGLVSSFIAHLPSVTLAAVALVVAAIFYFITSRIIKAGLKRTAMQTSLINIVVHSLYKWSIFIIALIFILGLFGVNVSAALAGVGVVGIGIGFAAKETLANMMSGFGIFIDKLYRHGDWVNIGGQSGEVKNITLRATKIRTLDNIYITIPNSLVTSTPITNYSEDGMVRLSTEVSIGYGESIDKARKVLLKAVATLDGIRFEPEPQVVVNELGDSAVKLFVRIWIDDAGVETITRFQLTEACKKALDKANIKIPFPQRELYISGATSKLKKVL